MRYRDRIHAGQVLAHKLLRFRGNPKVLVLGLPRGGVPVAAEVARALGAPLDVWVVRKLGTPDNPELAMGALASGGIEVWDEALVEDLGITDFQRQFVLQKQKMELARREELFRRGRPGLSVVGKIVLLVDDGLATGSTMKAAVQAVRKAGASRLVVAIPLASKHAVAMLQQEADEVVCIDTPEPFYAVGQGYQDFTQVEDSEVSHMLEDFGVAPTLHA